MTRFYAAAQSFGWGVRDSERNDERVAYFRQGTGTYQEAEALARAEAQRMNRADTLNARFDPGVIRSERAVHPAGLWFEERETNPTLDQLTSMQDLDDQLVAFIHLPTLVTMTAGLADDEFLVFVRAVGHLVSIVWDITSGWPDFWPDWEAVWTRLPEDDLILVRYPFSG
jgi:hypothetical protein